MDKQNRKAYATPELSQLGSVAGVTAAGCDLNGDVEGGLNNAYGKTVCS